MNSESGKPAISVVVPAFNGENYLAEAIRSILAQTLAPFEVVIVDDGSTDGTAALANSFGGLVRCISQAHAGAGTARNLGIEATSGPLIAFLDHDDLWPETSLEVRVEALLAAGADGAFGQTVQFRQATGAEEPPVAVPAAGALLVRRDPFLRTGLLDPALRVGEFIDWYSRARTAGLAFVRVPEVVLRRRLHDANMGLRAAANGDRADYVRILRAGLARRRLADAGEQAT